MDAGADWTGSICPDSYAQEKRIFENCDEIHRLPPIFHYWSNRHLLPKLSPFGFTGPANLFLTRLAACSAGPRPVRFLSLGAGNCDLEIDLARTLKGDFTIDCVDLNPAMLNRGRQAAEIAGVSCRLGFLEGDLNAWEFSREYDAIVANQSLHHVVNLEGLFEGVKRSLRPGGQFLISDMIGRNGHQRWPEALHVIHEFWQKLPPSYRFNRLLSHYEEMYQSWDCSVEGFEGIRSQDILPLLLEQFHFSLFVGYGNVIDPFIDRAFGGHFDPSVEWDRSFIDRVHLRDEEELASGRLKPTHMIAIAGNEPCPAFTGNFSPKSCIRQPSPNIIQVPDPVPYLWNSWPHSPQTELEIACLHLAETGLVIKQRTQWALGLANELEERTAWALSLDKDVQAHTAWALRIEKELEARTGWALSLQSEVEKRTASALTLKQQVETLEQQVEERTLWALRLKEELAEQIARAERLEREADHPLVRLAQRVIKLIMKLPWNTAP